MVLCEYGCGKDAEYELKNGKHCCSTHFTRCPAVKIKNAQSVSKAHAEGKCTSKHFTSEKRVDWSKNKTSLDDERLIRKYKVEQIFCENSPVGTTYVKKLLERMPDHVHRCSMCNNTEWLEKPIALELDHKNGNNRDNRKENLRFLCPNCHATTHTWKGRNKNGKTRIVSDEEFIAALKSTSNIRQALQKLGLSAMGKNYLRAYELLEKINKI